MGLRALTGFGFLLLILALGGLALAGRREAGELRAELERSQARLAKLEKVPCAAAPELGDRMNVLARRFSAVWFAGKSGNKELAKYELHEMEEVIESIQLLRPIENGVNVAEVLEGVAHSQLEKLEEAVESGDAARFEAAYKDTIVACNSCHRSAAHAFIQITTPSASPVPNRVWRPTDTEVKPVSVSGSADDRVGK